MIKKIIFVAPPNAGKIMLRKVFFKSENSSRLLESGLKPTHGQDSLRLRLDGLSDKINNSDLLEKIKKLKFDNIRAILEENYRETRKIALKIKNLIV